MPKSAKRPCMAPRCGNLVDRGASYCEEHARKSNRRQYDKRRGTAAQRGYGARWQTQRAAFLQAYPWCQHCPAPATVVDHIKPHRGDQVLFWDRDNWQPLCESCHNRKTARGE